MRERIRRISYLDITLATLAYMIPLVVLDELVGGRITALVAIPIMVLVFYWLWANSASKPNEEEIKENPKAVIIPLVFLPLALLASASPWLFVTAALLLFLAGLVIRWRTGNNEASNGRSGET